MPHTCFTRRVRSAVLLRQHRQELFAGHAKEALAVTLVAVLLLCSGPGHWIGPIAAADASTTPTPLFRAPVDAPVVDHFRPPTTRFGTSNLGLEYRTTIGVAVVAPADGVVAFSGDVAGEIFVTVAHRDGMRSTVGFVAQALVVAGEEVEQGQAIAVSGSRLHFSVRVGDQYIDPEPLLVGDTSPVRLVQGPLTEGDSPASIRAERALNAELLELVRGPGIGEILSAIAPDPAMVFDALLDGSVVGFLRRYVVPLALWRLNSGNCTSAVEEPEPPDSRRIAVLVGGLGSSSTQAGIENLDTTALGYSVPDVIRFSYRGGKVPGTGASASPSTEERPYSPLDSNRDLRDSSLLLLELLNGIAFENPGVPIDLYAHSQGGVVARLAISEASLPTQVESVVTIASPHNGADLANLLQTVRDVPLADTLLGSPGLVGGISPTGTAVEQLAARSDLIESLDLPPPDVRFLSIAARGDLVVPASATHVLAKPWVVVSSAGAHAHQDVVGSPETLREVRLHMAGLPPGCESMGDALADSWVGGSIDSLQSMASPLAELGRRLGTRSLVKWMRGR